MHGRTWKKTPHLAIDIARQDAEDGVRIIVRGEIDLTTGGRVERELLAAEERAPAKLIIDLTGVDFMDSTGLQIVLDADRRARDAGRALVIAAGTSEAARVLALAEVAKRLTSAVIE